MLVDLAVLYSHFPAKPVTAFALFMIIFYRVTLANVVVEVVNRNPGIATIKDQSP